MNSEFRAVGIFLCAMTIACGSGWAGQKWVAYKSHALGITVSVPADWSPIRNSKALGFRYDDAAGGTAAVGFLRSSQPSQPIEQQAEQEYNREGKTAKWSQSKATVAGMPAIKMVGVTPQDPNRRVVHYFVQAPNGVILVQCQGSVDRWSTFAPVFATILNKLKFNSPQTPS